MNDSRSQIAARIAFIGFGEAAQAFTAGWRTEAQIGVAAYDIKTDDTATRDAKLDDYRRYDVTSAMSAREAVSGADVIVSAVTADAVLAAADSVLPALVPRQLYLDINSAAPARKRQAAQRVGSRGADYVDVAVMGPVHPELHRTPLLIGGPGARRAEPLLGKLGMRFEVVSDDVGHASTIKMVRSVMIKGIESLTIECILSAVAAGIDDRILESLEGSFPGMNWKDRAGYIFNRVVVHGDRRAAEMREVAETLNDLGIAGTMAAATADHQQSVADLGVGRAFANGVPNDYRSLAKAILARQCRDDSEH